MRCSKVTDIVMDPATFLTELKRRKVYRVAVAYAIVAWLLIQAASILFPTFEASPWAMKELKRAKPDSSGYFKNLDLVSNAPERALLRGRGDAV